MRLNFSHVLVVGAALLAGCRRSAPHEVTNAFQWTDQIVAGGTLHLRDANGQISVVASPSGSVVIRGSKQWRRGRESDVRFVTNRIGNDVYVCAVRGRRSRCDERGYSASKPSFWNIFSLHGRSDMRADFDVQLPAGVKLDVLAMNGGASIDGVASDVKVSALNGAVTAHSRSGTMEIENVNGPIVADVDSLSTGPYRFVTVNGPVRVTLPAAFQGSVNLKTLAGSATTDFAVTGTRERNRIEGTVGSGNGSVTAKTVNGSVQLLRKG